jgi:hypothetical protein
MAKKGGRDTQTNFRHLTGDRTAVTRASTHATEFFRDHQQLQADFGSEHLTDDLFGKYFLMIPFHDLFTRQQFFSQLLYGVEHHLP